MPISTYLSIDSEIDVAQWNLVISKKIKKIKKLIILDYLFFTIDWLIDWLIIQIPKRELLHILIVIMITF